jgi:hypothetical protein
MLLGKNYYLNNFENVSANRFLGLSKKNKYSLKESGKTCMSYYLPDIIVVISLESIFAFEPVKLYTSIFFPKFKLLTAFSKFFTF